MRSIVLVVVICSILLYITPISPSPISIKISAGPDEMGSAEEDLTSEQSNEGSGHQPEKPKATDAPTTTEEPKATDAPTTNTPPMICKDLEMEDAGKFPFQLGDIPKPLAQDERILPINAIKLPKKSCKELYADGYRKSGLYIIKPGKFEVTVFCDMSLCGGGWTVIQRRLNKADIFNKNYADYQRGFGDLSSSYWLGLDAIHALTAGGVELHIGMRLSSRSRNTDSSAFYSNFSVGDAASEYRLGISGYHSSVPQVCRRADVPFWLIFSAGDSLRHHNGKTFSTYDQGQGKSDAVANAGGWWYSNYHFSDLNGNRIYWRTLRSSMSFTHSVMAVR